MSRYVCIALAALMMAGCFRGELREARRERPPLRDVFPPPSLEQAASASGADTAPTQAEATVEDEQAAPAPARPGAAGVAPAPGGFESEFTEARPAIEEVQQAAADTAAQDVAAAAAAAADSRRLDAGPGQGSAATTSLGAGTTEPGIPQRTAPEAGASELPAPELAGPELAGPELAAAEPGAEPGAPEPAAPEPSERAAGETAGAARAGTDRQAAVPRAPAAGQSASAPAPGEASEAIVQPLPDPQTRTPPRIVVSTRPAILVPLYGKPRMTSVPGTALTRIENTPAIVLKGKSGNYYIPVYGGFLQSRKLDGTWTVTNPVPKVLLTGKAAALKAGQQDLFTARPNARTGRPPALEAGAPRVIVTSQPTALVLVDGQPGYQKVAGTQLSRLVNSDAVLFHDAADASLYLQVGERWYRAASISGPWAVVPEGTLPAGIGTALGATP